MKVTPEELEALVLENKSLIHWCLKPYRDLKSSRFDYDDLVQVAYQAFLETIETYNGSKGELSTLAVIHISGRVRRFIRKNTSTFTLPASGDFDASQIPGTLALDKKVTVGEEDDLSILHGRYDDAFDYVGLLATIERICHSTRLDGDEVFNQWKLWRLGGYTHQEIGDLYGLRGATISLRLKTVERKLKSSYER